MYAHSFTAQYVVYDRARERSVMGEFSVDIERGSNSAGFTDEALGEIGWN